MNLLVGHSLGAGTAVLLGVLYRSIYPDLKVYAFSTPCKYLLQEIVLQDMLDSYPYNCVGVLRKIG